MSPINSAAIVAHEVTVPAYTRLAPLLKASSTSARPRPRLAPVTRTAVSAMLISLSSDFVRDLRSGYLAVLGVLDAVAVCNFLVLVGLALTLGNQVAQAAVDVGAPGVRADAVAFVCGDEAYVRHHPRTLLMAAKAASGVWSTK